MSWDIRDRTVLVTGGNAGIGKETAVALAERGARVVLTARDDRRGEVACEEVRRRSGSTDVEWMRLDLAALSSVRAFAADFLQRHGRLHVLINNAGLILNERRTTEDGFETTFGVNHLGHYLLTELLLERLLESSPARIINVSSEAHRAVRAMPFDDLQSERAYSALRAYGASKLANILHARELAQRLTGTGVTANAVHPGAVATRFGLDGDLKGILGVVPWLMRPFMLGAARGASTSVHVATAVDLRDVSGEYFARSRIARSTRAAADLAAATRLTRISEELIEQATPTSVAS